MNVPIQLTSSFNEIPSGTVFETYLMSIDMFDSNLYNYTVAYKKKEHIIPAKYITVAKSFGEPLPKSKQPPIPNDNKEMIIDRALKLIQKAEESMYYNSMIDNENEFRTFLETNGVVIDHSPRVGKCWLCNKHTDGSSWCKEHAPTLNTEFFS